MPRNVIRGLMATAVFVSVGFGWQTDALARQGARKAAARNARAVKAMTAAEVLSVLKTAHNLLSTADRDYAGHRALAAKEVQKAMHEMGHRHQVGRVAIPPIAGTTPPKQTAVATGQGKQRESQATSDAQLRQAQQLLQRALAHMNVRHPKAAANVQAAIGEIATALAIK